MIPFRDNIPSRTFPLVTWSIIVLNVLVFVYEWTLPASKLEAFIALNGLVPAKLDAVGRAPVATVAGLGRSMIWSMFLHGGWFHLIGNMWYLWIFGDNVEDRMGHVRFLFFYVACGVVASLAHLLFNLGSPVPSIGASGAVAGVLGAYLVSYPFARIVTIIPLFLIWPIVELPALLVLGFWFFVQLLSGVGSLGASPDAVGIAWWAHIGGFAAGLVLIAAFARPAKRRYRWEV